MKEIASSCINGPTSRGGLEVEYTASKVGALRRWFESRLGRNLRD